MTDKITLQELVTDIAQKMGQTETYSDQFLKTLIAVVEEGLLQDGQVSVSGLGSFRLKWMQEKTSKNAHTGEEMTVPAHNRVVFKPEKSMREYVNRKYARKKPVAFEKGRFLSLKTNKTLQIAASVTVASLSAAAVYFWVNNK